MSHPGTERRRAPRVKPATECRATLNGSVTVRVLDFSQSGVLLASKSELFAGDRAELWTIRRSNSVRVPVEIRHVALETVPRVGERYCAGAMFLAPEQAASLGALLRAERA